MGFFILGIGASILLPKLHRMFLVRKTESWPEVEGQVVSVEVIDHGAEGATADISYSYSVEGASYGGHTRRNFLALDHAWDFANRCREMKILVHYRPHQPDKSVVWQTIH